MDTGSACLRIWPTICLQWSHGPLAMDTTPPFSDKENTSQPSMEPWPFSHGYRTGQMLSVFSHSSLQWSHGPLAMDTFTDWRRYLKRYIFLQWSHGPLAMDTKLTLRVVPSGRILQWSHGPLAMDTTPSLYASTASIVFLQWSHGPLAMDTSSGRSPCRPGSSAFNGAMAL